MTLIILRSPVPTARNLRRTLMKRVTTRLSSTIKNKDHGTSSHHASTSTTDAFEGHSSPRQYSSPPPPPQQQQQVPLALPSTSETHSSSSSSSSSSSLKHKLLRGTLLDHAIDLMTVRPGDKVDIPYEITVSDTFQDFWFASFLDQNRIHTSRPFCRSMGLQDRVLPLSLALFLASSMSHEDAAKVQVGFGPVQYLWPLFAGDTLHKTFTVEKIRKTSDQNHSVIHFTCDLVNQRGKLCVRADKRMLFQFAIPESGTYHGTTSSSTAAAAAAATTATTPTIPPSPGESTQPSHHHHFNSNNHQHHVFRDHLIAKASTVLAHQPSHSLSHFVPGQLILHNLHRSLPFASSQQLASLARLTHERHYDVRTYAKDEIWVPAGLVLGLALSAAARDLHEILYEEISSCAYIHPLPPDTVVGAISYIAKVEENSFPGDLEVVTVVTLGIKNINVQRDLVDIDIPLQLFQPGLFTKEMEQICKQHCPTLSNKIVVQVERKLLRQSNRNPVFLL